MTFVYPRNNHYVKSAQMRSFSGLYFPVWSSNTGKNGLEKTPHLDIFYAVSLPFLRLRFDNKLFVDLMKQTLKE